MIPGYNYPNILTAAQGLLCDSVRVLRETKMEFVVVGGWSPFLLNSGAIPHPGTRDVDLLFKDGARPGALREAITKLRSAGYLHSAKHEFQLLRVLQVGNEDFVFNVDLLHASESIINPELFVDHIALPVRVSEFSPDTIPKRSIVVPVSAFIFGGHVVQHQVCAIDPAGKERALMIPLMDELGTIVSKASSMTVTKRPRDAFDIVIAIRQARNLDDVLDGASKLRTSHPAAAAELLKLAKFREEHKLRENVSKYWGEDLADSTWTKILEEIDAVIAAGAEQLADEDGE